MLHTAAPADVDGVGQRLNFLRLARSVAVKSLPSGESAQNQDSESNLMP